jgi:hypothetical protein
MIVAGFPAPAARIRSVLPSDKLKPVQVTAGKGAVALVAMEYGSIDGLAPYNEFTVMISVMYETKDNTTGLHGYYILHRLVTTEEARRMGREVFGYPTSFADITFEDSDKVRRCLVRSEGKDIITLEVRKLPTDSLSWDMYFYSIKGRELLRSHVQGQGQQGISGDRGGALYTLGSHPIADKLRTLQMNKFSVLHRYSPHWQSLVQLPGEHLPK